MRSSDPGFGTIAERYAVFSDTEARGSSETYARLAHQVARSDAALSLLSTLPPDRQQPNLFFAAMRWTGDLPAGPSELDRVIAGRGEHIRDVMLSRTTQTNEPARCATLLPILARLPQPLALIEVGASAGLCLLFDRYGYDFGRCTVPPAIECSAETPTFTCRINDATPVPDRPVEIVWRRGLDLNPLDVADPSDAAWLETLIWPEHAERAVNLRLALDVASADPPRVEKGNLLTDLERVAADAPRDATLVVFHTAVLAYVPSPEDRMAFGDVVRRVADHWISNESPHVFPNTADKVDPHPPGDRFLIALNGEPVAWAAPHGHSLDWIA